MKSDITPLYPDMTRSAYPIPATVDLSHGIYFRHLELEPAEWEPHAHPWGQINYLTHGVMHLTIAGRTFLSPPQYAIWIPPGVAHAAVNTTSATYRTVYLAPDRCGNLPQEPCAITIGAVLRAILDEFSRLEVRVPATGQQQRMAGVALDQIEASSRIQDYLPLPTSAVLTKVLEHIQGHLDTRQSTKELAARFHLTERTLERRCVGEIGVSIGEWQQRLRFLHALQALEQGLTIKQVALDLGYSSTSVFINMFRRITGQTPEQYRRTQSGNPGRRSLARGGGSPP